MAKLVNWLKKTVTRMVDPDREERVDYLTQLIHHRLVQLQNDFNLRSVLSETDFTERDLQLAKDRVVGTCLSNAWKDGRVTLEENSALAFVALKLEISLDRVRQLSVEHARRHFGLALAKAMEDGHIDQQEEAWLSEIAASIDMSLSHFARSFFVNESESFLRSLFLSCVNDGVVTERE